MAARAHRKLVAALLVLATLTGLLGIFAVWADRQLLDTDNWVQTSGKLLEDEAIRAELAVFLADEVYANVPVEQELGSVLPPRLAPLAEPAAGALRGVVERGALAFLERPRAQAAWERANRAAHSTFLAIVDDEGTGPLDSSGGNVTLDLGVLVRDVAARAGIGGALAERIPPEAAQLEIIDSSGLEAAQDAVGFLRRLAEILVILTLALFTLAVWLARGWRREALRACGFALVVAGVGALVARDLAASAVADSLASTDSVQPAAQNAFSIATSLLAEAAWATLLYGLALVLAATLAGPSPAAVRVRRRLAPVIREPGTAYASLAVLLLLLVVWAPTPAFEKLGPTILLAVLAALGLEALRRSTAREFPDAAMEPWNLRGAAAGAGERVRAALSAARTGGPDGESGAPSRIEELERLGALRDSGVLDDEEFASEKRRVMAGDG